MIPPEFLTTTNSSFTPGGISRLSNRPYSQIFKPSDFASVDMSKFKGISSPQELILRLDDLTCAGCHSGRSTNGFHYLGLERRNGTHRFNQLVVGFSEYSRVVQTERLGILSAKAQGQIPSSAVLHHSIKPTSGGAKYGSACAVGTSSSPGQSFAGWTCSAGLSCVRTDEPASLPELGKCFPKTIGFSGDPCNFGSIVESTTAENEYLKVDGSRSNCGSVSGSQCSDLTGGFPGGMCRRSCGSLDPSRESCGPIASTGFNTCLASSDKTFVDCLNDNTDSNGRSRCDANTPCRPDYSCVTAASGPPGTGACVPSYFFFQLGMDAHPKLDMTNPTVTLRFTDPKNGMNKMRGQNSLDFVAIKRRPIQASALGKDEHCQLPKGSVVGFARSALVSGHFALDVTAPSSAPGCEKLGGLVYVFKDHVVFF